MALLIPTREHISGRRLRSRSTASRERKTARSCAGGVSLRGHEPSRGAEARTDEGGECPRPGVLVQLRGAAVKSAYDSSTYSMRCQAPTSPDDDDDDDDYDIDDDDDDDDDAPKVSSVAAASA